MKVVLTRKGVEEMFAGIHSIAPSKRAAFQARLRHLQRLGIPPGTNTGKGTAASYAITETVILALALEMLELGITPERAARFILPSKGFLIMGAAKAIDTHGKKGHRDKFLLFDPSGLAELRAVQEDRGYLQRFALASGPFKLERSDTRMAVVNISATMQSLKKGIADFFGGPQDDAFRSWSEPKGGEDDGD